MTIIQQSRFAWYRGVPSAADADHRRNLRPTKNIKNAHTTPCTGSICESFASRGVGAGIALRALLRETLANICQSGSIRLMSTMNISLPETLKAFVDQQVAGRGYGTSSEYVRELIRKDQDRQVLRRLLLDGAESGATAPADEQHFAGLRERARRRTARPEG